MSGNNPHGERDSDTDSEAEIPPDTETNTNVNVNPIDSSDATTASEESSETDSDTESVQVSVDDILRVDTDDEEQEDDKPQIFAKPRLLEIDEIPDQQRIVGRDNHIKFLAENLRKMQTGDIVDNVLEWGETGTGKTLVARHVCERLETVTADSEAPIVTAYINTDPVSTFTSTFRRIAEQVNEKAEDPVDVPSTGLSADHYRNQKLWPIVEREFSGGLVVIIDEVDKHEDANELLYTLSRSSSKDSVSVPVVVIGISNDIDFKKEIDSRVQSTLQPEHRTFTPYDEEQLRAILKNRRDAFKEGVLEEGVVPKVAELAAEEHGDARRAVRLLRNAGEIAQENGKPTVTIDHVIKADERVEVELFNELVTGTPVAGKLLLFALSELARNNPDEDWFRTSEIHDVYERISKDAGVEPRGYNRALELLNKHVTTGVLESKKREGGGDGKYRSYSIQGNIKHTRTALIESTPALQDLMSWG
jgi:cell division control protein 6